MFTIFTTLFSKVFSSKAFWIAVPILILLAAGFYQLSQHYYNKGVLKGAEPVAGLQATIEKMTNEAREQHLKGVVEIATSIRAADDAASAATAFAMTARNAYLQQRADRAKATPAPAPTVTCSDGQVISVPAPASSPFMSTEGVEYVNTLIDQATRRTQP